MAIELSGVMPQHIPLIADKILPYLRNVEPWTKGRYLAEDMLHECETGLSWMFVAYEPGEELENLNILGVVIVTIAVYPRRKLLFVKFIGGDKTRLYRQDMYDLLKKFAVENGCDGIEGAGRIGWTRVFPEFEPVGLFGEINFVERGVEGAIQSDGHTDQSS